MEQAVLVLEDGTVFEGVSVGAPKQRTGEVVFNTAITGYQEIFTDPSYTGPDRRPHLPTNWKLWGKSCRQRSGGPFIEGLVVREISPVASNWRSEERAEHFLAKYDIPVIAEVDTRRLVRHLRDRGAMRGIIAAGNKEAAGLVEAARNSPAMSG